MNREEFNQWYDSHADAFPQTDAWVKGLPHPKNTIGYWLEALAKTDLADALEATRRLAIGTEPKIENWDRENTAKIVATIAAKVKASRTVVKKDYDPGPVSYREVAEATSELVDRYKTGIAEGRDKRELLEELIPVDPAREPRYRCLQCRDVGLVDVWCNRSIHEQMHGQPVKKRMGVCRCPCDAGAKRPGEHLAFYDPERFAAFNDGDLDLLANWCDGYNERNHRRHDFGEYAMPTIPIRATNDF